MLAFAIGLAAQAAPPARMPADPPRIETKHLTVATSAEARAVVPGSRVSLWIDVTPKPAMHVYAPEQKDFIPISLRLESRSGVTSHTARFPAPETMVSPATQDRQRIYSKPFRIVQEVTVGAAARGTVTVKGALKYQACDDSICYAPVTIPVAWTLELKQPGKVTP